MRRQLKHHCLLTPPQVVQENDLTVWKFQRVMMRRRTLFVDLPKNRRSVKDFFPPPTQQAA
ncbi:MAG: hypothetical protein WA728_08765 [Xanthobacteraceae bacterium]